MEYNASSAFPDWILRLDKATPVYTADSPAFLSRAYSTANDGVVMTILTVVLTLGLELASFGDVLNICKNKQGATLYAQAVALNILNNCILGPLAYELVSSNWMSAPFTLGGRVAMTAAVVLGHAVGYYCAHRWMHTRRMYWAHRFHHRFNKYVVPVTANAVSLAEYAIAYMLPFIAGSILLRPDRCSMFVSVGIISFNNLLVHTPFLCDISAK